MSGPRDFLYRSDPRYIIAVICDHDLSATAIIELMHRRNIECADVMYYDEEENYAGFLLNRNEEEGGMPLLFIFSGSQLKLVQSYNDLVSVEQRLTIA